MTVRILIADDHAMVRQGLRMFLGLDPEFRVVGEAGDGATALELTRQLRPRVVLMDLLMPIMDGIEATVAIRCQVPETAVLIVTGMVDDFLAEEALQAGAVGWLHKDASIGELRQAVREAAGQTGSSDSSPVPVRAPASPDVPALTDRELAVLELLVLGYSNKDIARALQISDPTVKTHVSSILSKLAVSNRTQAVLYAIRTGLVTGRGARRVSENL